MQSENSVPTRCKVVSADLMAYSHFIILIRSFFFFFFWNWFCLSVEAFERFHKINSKGVNRKAAVFLIYPNSGTKWQQEWKKTPVWEQKIISVCTSAAKITQPECARAKNSILGVKVVALPSLKWSMQPASWIQHLQKHSSSGDLVIGLIYDNYRLSFCFLSCEYWSNITSQHPNKHLLLFRVNICPPCGCVWFGFPGLCAHLVVLNVPKMIRILSSWFQPPQRLFSSFLRFISVSVQWETSPHQRFPVRNLNLHIFCIFIFNIKKNSKKYAFDIFRTTGAWFYVFVCSYFISFL